MRPQRVVRYVNAQLTPVSHDECRVTVELRRDSGEAYVGTKTGGCGQPEAQWTAARAAAEAVCQAADLRPDALSVHGVSLSDLAGTRTVMVALTIEGSPTPLVGSCAVLGDASRATALAVLNATNRFLGLG